MIESASLKQSKNSKHRPMDILSTKIEGNFFSVAVTTPLAATFKIIFIMAH